MTENNSKPQTALPSDAASGSTNRRNYSPPTLKPLGNVRDLTDGGSGQANEGSMNTDPTRRP
jgi:hypothetical protein